MKQNLVILTVALTSVALATAGMDLNSSIRVKDGEVRRGELSTLNGGIRIGNDAEVLGSCHSINGGITVGDHSRVEELNSVNGGIRIGRSTVVRGDVSSINGALTMGRNSSADAVQAINGTIHLSGAEIDRNVVTINGNITLDEGTLVRGDVVVKEPDSHKHRHDRDDVQRIELEDGSVVEGDIIVEDPHLDVEVFLRGGSRVNGRIEGAKVIRD